MQPTIGQLSGTAHPVKPLPTVANIYNEAGLFGHFFDANGDELFSIPLRPNSDGGLDAARPYQGPPVTAYAFEVRDVFGHIVSERIILTAKET